MLARLLLRYFFFLWYSSGLFGGGRGLRFWALFHNSHTPIGEDSTSSHSHTASIRMSLSSLSFLNTIVFLFLLGSVLEVA